MRTNIQDVSFDAETTLAMGEAFDRACRSLPNFGMAPTVREIIAKRILEVAKTGERDPTRLCEQALGFKEEGHNRFAAQGDDLDGEWGIYRSSSARRDALARGH